MKIELKKFGGTLISRQAGKEAWLAFQPVLRDAGKDEEIVVDFADVGVLAPSWAAEFILPLKEKFPGKVTLVNTENPSVKATLELFEKINRGEIG